MWHEMQTKQRFITNSISCLQSWVPIPSWPDPTRPVSRSRIVQLWASHNNLPKLIPAHWLLLTLLATLVLSLMNASLSLTKYLLSLNLAIIIFVNFAVFVLIFTSKLPVNTIATSIVYSKLDYCYSLYYNLPQSQIKIFQNIQNSFARAVTRTPKSSHITPVLNLYIGSK